MAPKFKRPYDPSVPCRVSTVGPSLTRQSEADACDINRIMAKFEKTGVIDHLGKYEGRYGDFIDAPGYQEACNQVLAAQDAFASLPALIRKRFENDPAAFLDFAQNPANSEELVKMGLAHPVPVAVPVVSPAVSDPVIPS